LVAHVCTWLLAAGSGRPEADLSLMPGQSACATSGWHTYPSRSEYQSRSTLSANMKPRNVTVLALCRKRM